MAKRITITLLMIALVIFISFSYYFISGDGEFSISSYSTASEKLISKKDNVYMSYRLNWRGIGHPTIDKIEFIRRDGTNTKNDGNMNAFIANKTEIGLLDEKSVLVEELNDNFVPINGYKVKDKFYVILRVELTETLADNDIHALRIIYSKYGRKNSQNIPLEEGVISDS